MPELSSNSTYFSRSFDIPNPLIFPAVQVDPADQFWLQDRIQHVPHDIQPYLLKAYASRRASVPGVSDRAAKNIWLSQAVKDVSARTAYLCGLSDREICDLAREHHERELRQYGRALRRVEAGLMHESEVPKPRTEAQCRRDLRNLKRRTADMLGHRFNAIGEGRMLRTTDYNVSERRQQLERWKKFQEQTQLIEPESGEIKSLADLSAKQRKGREGELHALLNGIKSVAEKDKLCWSMFTFTAPAHMHPGSRHAWDNRSTPADAHRRISDDLRHIDKMCHLQDIARSGITTCEAHQDGAPHVHQICYYDPEQEKALLKIIGSRFQVLVMKQKPKKNDPRPACHWIKGLTEPTEKMKKEGKKPANFASYAMKYVLKSMRDENGGDSREDSWHSTWGIRRYRFFGVPTLSTWRHLHSLREAPEGARPAAMWRAVRRGDGEAFIRYNGGLAVKGSERFVRCSMPAGQGHQTSKSWNLWQRIAKEWDVTQVFNRPTWQTAQKKFGSNTFSKLPETATDKASSRTCNASTGTYSLIVQENLKPQNQPPKPQEPEAKMSGTSAAFTDTGYAEHRPIHRTQDALAAHHPPPPAHIGDGFRWGFEARDEWAQHFRRTHSRNPTPADVAEEHMRLEREAPAQMPQQPPPPQPQGEGGWLTGEALETWAAERRAAGMSEQIIGSMIRLSEARARKSGRG